MNDANKYISDDDFNNLMADFAANDVSILDILEQHGITKHAFYKCVGLDEKRAEKYARARTTCVENRVSNERDRLNDECLKKLESCDPKIANALQNHYKERVRQLEWDAQKLLPRKYGDRIQVDTNDVTIKRAMTLPAKLPEGKRVSE